MLFSSILSAVCGSGIMQAQDPCYLNASYAFTSGPCQLVQAPAIGDYLLWAWGAEWTSDVASESMADDSGVNTYVELARLVNSSPVSGGQFQIEGIFCTHVVSGTNSMGQPISGTVTVTGHGVDFHVMQPIVVHGLNSCALNGSAASSTTNTGSGKSTWTTGNLTTTAAHSWILAALKTDQGFVTGSFFTPDPNYIFTGRLVFSHGQATEMRLVTPGTYTATFSEPEAGDNGALLAIAIATDGTTTSSKNLSNLIGSNGDSLLYLGPGANPLKVPTQNWVEVGTNLESRSLLVVNMGLGGRCIGGGGSCTDQILGNLIVDKFVDTACRPYNIYVGNGGMNDITNGQGLSVATVYGRVQSIVTEAAAVGFQYFIFNDWTSLSDAVIPIASRRTFNSTGCAAATFCLSPSGVWTPGDGTLGSIPTYWLDSGSDGIAGCDLCYQNTTYFYDSPPHFKSNVDTIIATSYLKLALDKIMNPNSFVSGSTKLNGSSKI